jgi:hypothetical protein
MGWSTLRFTAAAVGLSGVVAGFIVNVDRATRDSLDMGLVLANYFSLFTIISTLISAYALIRAGVWDRRNPGKTPEPVSIALPLALATAPMILLGIVYNALLRGLPSDAAASDPPFIGFLDTYAAEVLHVVLPVYFVVDLLFAHRRRGLRWVNIAVLAAYPLAWLVYTIIRGQFTPDPYGVAPAWYPYPFLDPNGAGGWASVFTYVAVMLVAFVGIAAAVIAIGRFRARRAERRSDSSSPTEERADAPIG